MAADVLDVRVGREEGDCKNAWTLGCSMVQVPSLRTPRETLLGKNKGIKDEQRAFRAKRCSSFVRLPRGSYWAEGQRRDSKGGVVAPPKRSWEVGKRERRP